ncbi:MAG: sulfatase-like hydrolase/transferase, partial [Muribaculaceae bacterium]|nr:sulfatase-like hydrolase/transferase [Muribaculaceae bacterium]
LRLVLMIVTPESLGIGFGGCTAVLGLGLVNDLMVGILSLVFIWAYLMTIGNSKYRRIPGAVILTLLAASFIYVSCFNTIFDEYGSVVPMIARGIFGFWLASFALRYFIPQIRIGWARSWFWIISGLYVLITIFNAAGEYFFWDEFNVRYNFIAVDYLIYTNEVVGNIMESYAMVPLMLAVVAVSAALTGVLFRKDASRLPSLLTEKWKVRATLGYAAAAAIAWLSIPALSLCQRSDNIYYNELQANGVYKFADAFTKNHLEYRQFYHVVDDAEATINAIYGSCDRNMRTITADSTALVDSIGQPNIVLITMESMSADFMERYGNPDHITPSLDSLAKRSLTFDCLIATGNRTVRGLEALSLSLPPSPGESVIKRNGYKGLRTTGALLDEMGYRSIFLYGGNSYFDNMGAFFGSNGYEVIDINDFEPDEIVFKNIWGMADESSYDKLIKTLDNATEKGSEPVFIHMMTISNHRPFTYPEGRIPIPTDSKSRRGGVMYADYSLGRFIEMAKKQPWFDNTVFVIVADHCASSAGKTELPIEKYHIPAMIYAPGLVEPQSVDKLCSQIDLMPTLFALLGLGYESAFYGKNIMAEDYEPRAFLATYENLGYLVSDTLTVLSPGRRVEQSSIRPTTDNPLNTEPVEQIDSAFADRAAAYYQTSAEWYAPVLF